MSLDIHRLENGHAQERLMSIDDAEFGLLEPAFKLFAQKTGLLLEPYWEARKTVASGANGAPRIAALLV